MGVPADAALGAPGCRPPTFAAVTPMVLTGTTHPVDTVTFRSSSQGATPEGQGESVPDDEYGVGVDVGDSTVAAAICPTGADGGRLPDRLALGGAPAGHAMAQVGSTALPRTTSAARDVADEVVRLAGLAADRQRRPPRPVGGALPPFLGPRRGAPPSPAPGRGGGGPPSPPSPGGAPPGG